MLLVVFGGIKVNSYKLMVMDSRALKFSSNSLNDVMCSNTVMSNNEHRRKQKQICVTLWSALSADVLAPLENICRLMALLFRLARVVLIYVIKLTNICRIKTGSGGVCCHNARGRVRNRKSNPDGEAGGIWRTVRTSQSALWQQTPTDRS